MTTNSNTSRAMNPRILGILILVLTILTVGQNIYYAREQAEQVRCQTEFVSNFTSSLQARSDVSAQDREALDTLVESITMAFESQEPDAIREALNAYNETRAQADADRAANPYPSTSLSEECVTP